MGNSKSKRVVQHDEHLNTKYSIVQQTDYLNRPVITVIQEDTNIINDLHLEKDLRERIRKGDIEALYQLGNLYCSATLYDEAATYYLLASEKGHYNSMCKLSNYYSSIGDNKEMLKYLEMATKHSDKKS